MGPITNANDANFVWKWSGHRSWASIKEDLAKWTWFSKILARMEFVKKWWTLGVITQVAKSDGSRPSAVCEDTHFFAKNGSRRSPSTHIERTEWASCLFAKIKSQAGSLCYLLWALGDRTLPLRPFRAQLHSFSIAKPKEGDIAVLKWVLFSFQTVFASFSGS